MKLAVPTTHDNQVDSHFGHCEFFTVFAVEDSEIINSQIVESPEGCGCKSNIVSVLREMGVEIMLAGNMGGGAVNVLNNNGIAVIRGCEGDATSLVKNFITGEVVDSGETCSHHEHHHQEGNPCGHNH
jgi:predicted Fe-Mo cluster-binding NifX family protein